MLQINDNIRKHRELKGYSQQDVADLIGEKRSTYAHWKQNVEHKLNPTRRKEIRRKFEKVITSYKIVIYHLTPFYERTEDIPALINRKTKKDEN